MKKELKAKQYIYSYTEGKNNDCLTSEEIVESYVDGFIDKLEGEKSKGLRKPQYGALCAIRANWTIDNSDMTVVLPTGTGKSETMIATIISEKIHRTLIVVPNALLRDQIFDRVKELGMLRHLGCVKESVISPNTLCLKSSKIEVNKFKKLVTSSNIIITTINLTNFLSNECIDILKEFCDLLIIDEAHHISSKTWKTFKKLFLQKKILQFTATPFREDGKIVDGKIIYNFPLKNALELGYFKPINFIAVEEYDKSKYDEKIAKKSVSLLKEDLENGFNHTLLVRAGTIEKAEKLYSTIYSQYRQYNPVLITSKQSKSDRNDNLNKLIIGKSRIIVCVDMFGEGIDMPTLKIAALHDKFKSLPITLQFVGRFARSKQNLGEAKVIANIADINVKDTLADLYSSNAEWNLLLPKIADSKIQEKVTFQEIIEGFNGNTNNEIDISQIRAKVSMKAYQYNVDNCNFDNWVDVFDEFNTYFNYNSKENIIVIIEPIKSIPSWTTQRDINILEWDYYFIYWNKTDKFICANSSNHIKCKIFLEKVFLKNELVAVNGEKVFRCLSNIKRLTLATVGLNSAINGPIRYKMFAGIDIALGISEANKANCQKSNIFGMGYEGNGKISIGCSYKGKIWSRWVEDINFWKNWCNNVMAKILDEKCNSTILENILVPEVITNYPKDFLPYKIEFDEMILTTSSKLLLSTTINEINFHEVDLKLLKKENNIQKFLIITPYDRYSFSIEIDKNNYKVLFNNKIKEEPKIVFSNKKSILVSEYLNENPPRIWYTNGSSIEGNLMLKPYKEFFNVFDKRKIISWNWKQMGVNIRVESQYGRDGNLRKDSIQYALISKLKQSKKYDLIFDDDGSGEIADVIAFRSLNKKVEVEFYHCKYSKSDSTGCRMSDLYEVCGQAEKSVTWKANPIELINRMKYRHNNTISRFNRSRFCLGDLKSLGILENKILNYGIELKVYVVQPGINVNKITKDAFKILGATSSFCKDTYSISLGLICNES